MGCANAKVAAEEQRPELVPEFFDKAYEPRSTNITIMKGVDGLGMRLMQERRAWGWAMLVKAYKAVDGRPSAAERSPKINIGDAILAIEGVDVPRLENDLAGVSSDGGADAEADKSQAANGESEKESGTEKPNGDSADASGSGSGDSGSGSGSGVGSNGKDERPIDLKAAVAMLRDAPVTTKLKILKLRVETNDNDKGKGKGKGNKKGKMRKNSLAKGVDHAVTPAVKPPKFNPDQLHNPAPRDSWEQNVENAVCGSLAAVKDEVIFHWSRINRVSADLGETMLHMLCREGYVFGARFVLDPSNHAARERVPLNPNVKNKKGRTPLLLCFTPEHLTASARGQPKLEDPVPNDTLMKPGHEEERTEIVRMLIRAGADINVVDVNDYTPLHLAAMWNWGACCEALLQSGAPPERKNARGETALHLACKHGDPERPPESSAAIALMNGMTQASLETVLEVKDDRGNAVVHYASMMGNDAVISLIIEKNGDVMTPNHRDETPLKLAVRSGRTRAASILMQQPLMMRRKSAIAAAVGDMKTYLMDRLAMGAYAKKKKSKEKKSSKYNRQTPEERELLERKNESKNYNVQGDWQRFNDPYNGSRVYYFNKETHESSWDPPPGWERDPADAPRLRRGGGRGWVKLE